MQHYLDHPTEEALERFLLNQSPEVELEILETHILACESCVQKLEILETQIKATKIALRQFQRQTQEKITVPRHSWKAWFTIPHLSWAGALAAVLFGVAAIPLFTRADVSLSSYRGTETTFVPEWRPLHMHLNAADLSEGPVTVQLVDATGTQLWQRSSAVRGDQVNVDVPRLTRSGDYFLRLYAPSEQNGSGDLLREFAFQVK